MKPESDIKSLISIPLFTAMTAVGAYIAVPLPWSPVPIVLQNFFILLSGLVLGGKSGAAAVGLYLFMGALGLPVFAGGTGGIAHFAGPTAGYLISYLPAVLLVGVLRGRNPGAESEGRRGNLGVFLRDLGAACAGVLLIYAAGLPWLKLRLGLPWEKALLAGLLPFLPGDLLKAAAAAALARSVRRIFREEGIGEGA